MIRTWLNWNCAQTDFVLSCMFRGFFEGQALKEISEMVYSIPKAYSMVELAGARKGMVEQAEQELQEVLDDRVG